MNIAPAIDIKGNSVKCGNGGTVAFGLTGGSHALPLIDMRGMREERIGGVLCCQLQMSL